MNRALQSWSPRTRPLNYDSLQQDIGCQDTTGNAVYSVKPFVRVCVTIHDTSPVSAFNRLDTVSYATGPKTTNDNFPWPTRWAAWVSSSGVRAAKIPEVTPPANNVGNPTTFYPTTKPTKLSLSFIPEGRMAIAIQKSADSIEVKWFENADGSIIGSASFLGISGVLFQTGILPHDDDGEANDLVVYYLRREIPRTIFARFRRDNFAVEYVINENLQATVTSLVTVEAVGSKLALFARDVFGRDVTLYTSEYILTVDGDEVRLSASVFSGSYRATAIKRTVGPEKTQLSISVYSGAYNAPVQEPATPLPVDAATLTLSVDSGEYF